MLILFIQVITETDWVLISVHIVALSAKDATRALSLVPRQSRLRASTKLATAAEEPALSQPPRDRSKHTKPRL